MEFFLIGIITFAIVLGVLVGILKLIGLVVGAEQNYRKYKRGERYKDINLKNELPSIDEFKDNLINQIDNLIGNLNESIYCQECDSRISKKSLFCSYCGAETPSINKEKSDYWGNNSEEELEEEITDDHQNIFTQSIGIYLPKV